MPKVLQPDNPAAPGVPYYTPLQNPPAGTAILSDDTPTPPLFTPITIRSLTLPNRLWVSPMCTYSTKTGELTPWHLVHLGSFAMHGAGLTTVEATAVAPEGRISPQDSGLWSDSQIPGLKAVADFIHSQSKHIAIQLAHAGRKASTVAPWLGGERGKSILASASISGWPNKVVGPSAISWSDDHAQPVELTLAQIKEMVTAFVASAERAVAAGVDAIEIHSAHGYLIHSFLSGASNTRTDDYGGSFHNRVRLLLEIITAVRTVIPDGMPLFVRLSATDWLPAETYPTAWTEADTIRLSLLLAEPTMGVDLLDISSGGNHPEQQIAPHNDYQVAIAGRVRTALHEAGLGKSILVGAVGMISDGKKANEIVESGKADVCFAARAFLRDPGFVRRAAEELGVGESVKGPWQYHRAGKGRRSVML